MTILENRIFELANERWPNRDLPNRMRKLGEEVGELAEAVARLQWAEGQASDGIVDQMKEAVRMEAADCAIVLTDLLALLDRRSLNVAMRQKVLLNANGSPDPNDPPER